MLIQLTNSNVKPNAFPIDIVGYGLSLPTRTLPISRVLEVEAARVQRQLAGLSALFRERLMSQLGLEHVVCEDDSCSRQRARQAAEQALTRAGMGGRDVSLIVEYSTYAADVPRLWSLGHDVQNHIKATDALVLGVRGSGCCGLHLALRTAQAFLHTATGPGVALLVASDRAPEAGRVCLPISIMSDAASALVLTRADAHRTRVARVHAVQLISDGRYVDVLSSTDSPPAISIDTTAFEQQLAPVHFVMLNRALSRALDSCGVSRELVTALVYPNTTLLDRQSATRALNFDPGSLAGPGPANLGHAFSNDLIINAKDSFEADAARARYAAWIAAGSGFTWGAAIVESGQTC